MPNYQNRDDTFSNEYGRPNTFIATPLTGTTVVIPFGALDVFINPAGTIATLTIQLPKAVENNMCIDVGFGATVTAITWKDGFGNTLSGLAASGAAGVATEIKYVAHSTTPGAPAKSWVKWR